MGLIGSLMMFLLHQAQGYSTSINATSISTSADYTLYCSGDCNNFRSAAPLGGVLLAGGSTDQDDAMRWMVERADEGDFVVLRASGSDGYNDYLLGLGRLNSVTSIVFHNAAAAAASEVLNLVDNADAIFLAGGDQWNYVSYFVGSPLQARLQAAAGRNAVFGGTSAGCAVLGEFIFSAQNGGVTSDEALSDPYNRFMTIADELVQLPYLQHVITDQHFAQRDRIGRLVAMLARLAQDERDADPLGVGVDERTCLAAFPDGRTEVFGSQAVYLLQGPPAERCEEGEPLSVRGIQARRLVRGDQFNLASRTGDGVTYSFDIVDGRVIGNPYGP